MSSNKGIPETKDDFADLIEGYACTKKFIENFHAICTKYSLISSAGKNRFPGPFSPSNPDMITLPEKHTASSLTVSTAGLLKRRPESALITPNLMLLGSHGGNRMLHAKNSL